MEVVLNATLAGGIIVGSCCCLVVSPAFAMGLGAVGGIVSALGYLKLNSFVQEYAYLYDTCGVQFLHGIPGLLGGIAGAFVTYFVEFQLRDDKGIQGNLIANIYHAMGDQRDSQSQGLMQFAAVGVTMAIALLSGALTGLLTSKAGEVLTVYNDEEHWEDEDGVLSSDEEGDSETVEFTSEQKESSDNAPMETDSRFNVDRESHRESDARKE